MSLLIALLTAGGAPQPPPAGLISAGLPTSWAVPLLRFLADIAAIATGGALLTATLLLSATNTTPSANGPATDGVPATGRPPTDGSSAANASATDGGMAASGSATDGKPATGGPATAARGAGFDGSSAADGSATDGVPTTDGQAVTDDKLGQAEHQPPPGGSHGQAQASSQTHDREQQASQPSDRGPQASQPSDGEPEARKRDRGRNRNGNRQLGPQALRACQDAAVAAGVWAVASIGGLITSAAVILGIPLSHIPDHASAAGELDQVRALAVTVVLTAILAVILSGCRTTRGARFALLLTALALIPPLLTGHGAIERTSFWSLVATSSLVLHVFAATAWIGGLGGVLRYARERTAVERFSRLALICAITMGITGLLTAEIHLGGREDGWALLTQWVTTGYGALVFAKAIAFAILVTVGWWHRRTTLPDLATGNPTAFRRLALVELLIMAATIGLAVALSRTP